LTTKKRSPTLKQKKEAFQELGKLLEELRHSGKCSKVLIDMLEEYKQAGIEELFKQWLISK
jgi:hypothetical protein